MKLDNKACALTMDSSLAEKLSQMPEEMLAFTLDAAIQRGSPRLGTLVAKNRKPISTPNYIPSTSRGVVPHLSHDKVLRHTKIRAMYMGLEDCEFARTNSPAAG